jgi:hypothetical protein
VNLRFSKFSFAFTLTLCAIIGLAACSSSDDYAEYDEGYSTESADISDYEGEEKGNETYSEFDQRRDSYDGSRGAFAGYDCTEDCSGHEAGYQWAEENGIEDPDDCGGKSWSFEEGCRAFAEENGGI